ncbi:MAG: zf-HC2 domain-containing protein [Planctomycetes bacterium]|nr:zf-HC2 domain-containing protein [Planctomycetota bacterium]
MRCDQVKQSLVDLAYGELPRGDSKDVKAHLVACDRCRVEWEALAESRELLDHAADFPPADVVKILAEAHRREVVAARRRRRRVWSAVAAAALLAAVGIAQLQFERRPSQVIIGWSDADPAPVSPPQAPGRDPIVEKLQADLDASAAALADCRRRLDDLDQLAVLIVQELKSDDLRRAHAIESLHERIEEVRRQNDARWQAVGRGFHNWHLAQRLESREAIAVDPPAAVMPLKTGDSP